MKTLTTLSILGAAAFTMIAATPLTSALEVQPGSTIWVSGTSTVKNYKCASKGFTSEVVATSAQPKDLSFAKLVRSADISVPVAGLECGNGTMNSHMRNALKADKNPTITFKLTDYQMGAGSEATINGVLTIAGKELPVVLTGKVTEEAGIVRATATREVNMKDWGVKPPSLMLGTMKVRELATIGFDITLKR